MANNEQTTEQTTKTQIAARVDPTIFAAIEDIATEEERSISNVIERLLKESPRVEARLLAAGAAA